MLGSTEPERTLISFQHQFSSVFASSRSRMLSTQILPQLLRFTRMNSVPSHPHSPVFISLYRFLLWARGRVFLSFSKASGRLPTSRDGVVQEHFPFSPSFHSTGTPLPGRRFICVNRMSFKGARKPGVNICSSSEPVRPRRSKEKWLGLFSGAMSWPISNDSIDYWVPVPFLFDLEAEPNAAVFTSFNTSYEGDIYHSGSTVMMTLANRKP